MERSTWSATDGRLHLVSAREELEEDDLTRIIAAIALIGVLVSSPCFADGGREVLGVGDALPDLVFVDIEEKPVDRDAYRGWVQVVTFADRESSEEIKLWMRDAQIRATRAHPEFSIAYLTFADLASVPRFMRGVVRPLLRRTFENSNEELAESYREVGIDADPAKVAFRFIPDWVGSYLEAFGLDDATRYRCWIVVDGRVIATFDASTPGIADRYVEAFDRLDPAPEIEEVSP